jgi:small subunit ribosomal protein S8
MTMTDPIADFLTRIRNGVSAAHETVEVPASKLKEEVARILAEQGYIDSYERRPRAAGAGEVLVLALRYSGERRSAISGIERVSRPGRRTYVDAKSIPKVLGGMGTAIISTSQGVMSGHEARLAGVGGELLARVW